MQSTKGSAFEFIICKAFLGCSYLDTNEQRVFFFFKAVLRTVMQRPHTTGLLKKVTERT